MARSDIHYDDLAAPDRALVGAAWRSGTVVVAATAAATLVGWAWLALMAAETAALDPASPAAEQIAWLGLSMPSWMPDGLRAALAALCSPATTGGALVTFGAAFAMWAAMSVAMMMPSAAPMLRTYADIAQAAAEKGERVCSVWMIAAGYLAVWSGFALAAAALQTMLLQAGLAASLDAPVVATLGAAALMVAGLYQFSALKDACLEKCRNPFATLFGRWSTRPAAVFRLGVEQGMWCLGCCWALMLVMFAVGTMNLAWMAVLALFTLLEKTGTGKATTHVVGATLAAWGGALFALALAA